MQQSIDGDTKSFQLDYIDWRHPENNVYHVTEEFVVERTGSHETRRPDVVLFVNGIPLVVIECKRPDLKDPIDQAVSQQIRNQQRDQIPRLFHYAQLLLSLSKNEAKYATVGTPAKFWSVWKERNDVSAAVAKIINLPLTGEQKDHLFSERFRYVREYFEALERDSREATKQDQAIYSLCRPERLLELTYRFILFDAGEKKIARYQQYFCVNKIMDRIRRKQRDGTRKGGVVWHTQGSGKSLTMVMLAEAIALESGIDDYKIILVTDRVDLDDQIYKTFHHCGTVPVQAKTGKHLAELLRDNKARIITTVIDKFELAVSKAGVHDENPDIFVLVDEGHRSQTGKFGQFGKLHNDMRRAMPNACFIAFTGTPLLKGERNTISTFGGLIDIYTIDQAVKDKAVVPLLYEGRHVDQKVDTESIDAWFDRITENLSREQKADLKKKFASTDQLNKAQQKVMRIAWDVSEHYRDNWQGTPYKAQLVTQDKATALLYKRFLDDFGLVSNEVLISGPDEREGEEDVHEAAKDKDEDAAKDKERIKAFWTTMMAKYGSEKEYNRQIISAFKHSENPEIIIVVDKLLTGFDAPRNTVLYLTRKLTGHTLLQAIARVNRLYDGKDFGYIIDYRGVLQNLDEALDIYGKLSEFDKEGLDDLCTALMGVDVEVQKLPQRHSDMWDLFKSIRNRRDEEAYERLLADEELRGKFYERLSAYSRTLSIALSSSTFLEATPEDKLMKYKADLRFFMKLRTSVRKRYAEVVDFKEYESRIQKLLDQHVGTGEVEIITDLVNIFDANAFAKEVEKLGSTASKADTIAYRTKRRVPMWPSGWKCTAAGRSWWIARPVSTEFWRWFWILHGQGMPDFNHQNVLVEYAGEHISVDLRFRKRKRLSISVTPDGSVTALAPAGRSLEDVLEHLRRRRTWIAKQRRHFEKYQPLPEEKRYVSGETHLYLGRQYRLRIRQADETTVKLIGRFFHVYLSRLGEPHAIAEAMEAWYQLHAESLLRDRLDRCLESAISLKLTKVSLRVRPMKRRWGSCSKAGTITLNIDLVKAPLHCIDYVIMHELCHRRYHNHSPAFFRLLSLCMPDWKRRKERLELVIVR